MNFTVTHACYTIKVLFRDFETFCCKIQLQNLSNAVFLCVSDALSAQKHLYERELAKLKEQLESSSVSTSSQSPQPPKLTTLV